MARIRRMETLNQVLTWEPLASLGALLFGWIVGFWQWFSARDLKKELCNANCKLDASLANQTEMLALMRSMEGRSAAEQRGIVKKAEALPLRMELRLGRPVALSNPPEPKERDHS